MIYALTVIILALVATIVIEIKLHYQEKKEIFDRFMAGDYKSYEYYQKEYPGLVEEREKRMAAEREKVKTKAEVEAEKKAKGF